MRALTPESGELRFDDGKDCTDILSVLPETKCLILTAFDDDDAAVASVVAGAAGYLLKDVRGPELIAAILSVAAGRSLIHPAAAHRIHERVQSSSTQDPRFGSLNMRERQILSLITDGLTNRQIGHRLHLNEKTIKNYVSTMLRKLGLAHRTQAAIYGLGQKEG